MDVLRYKVSLKDRSYARLIGVFYYIFVDRFIVTKVVFNYIFKVLRFNCNRIVDLKGIRLYIVPARSILEFRVNLCRCYEPEVVSFLENEIHLNMNVIDVGANIGVFTVLAAKRVGKLGKIIAFEPNPENYLALIQNIKLNKLKNITTQQVALSDSTKLVKMGRRDDNALHSFAYNTGEDTFDAHTIRLDDCLKEIDFTKDTIDFIKIDIEGAEMLALKGMQETLSNNSDIKLLIEVHQKQLLELGSSVQQLLSFLKEMGFLVFNLYKDGKIEIITDDSQKVSSHIICSRKYFQVSHHAT